MVTRNLQLNELLSATIVFLDRLLYMFKYNEISVDDIIKHSQVKIELLEKNLDTVKYVNKKNKIINLLHEYKKALNRQ